MPADFLTSSPLLCGCAVVLVGVDLLQAELFLVQPDTGKKRIEFITQKWPWPTIKYVCVRVDIDI